ncbi:hypothetical protein TK06_09960 [Pseudomonas fluorescens]|uniref:Uncharacterized protein n=1 Tax=Pseudomonas fluorescens TaxID=294 RepID=A0A159ZW55_PSEFL|nr:hypothetical protein TK06_09960 [Pseudomonas fluorescens]
MVQVFADAISVACSQRSACRAVITTSSQEPIFALAVMVTQDGGGNLQISMRSQQLTRVPIKMALMSQVDLCKTCVYL